MKQQTAAALSSRQAARGQGDPLVVPRRPQAVSTPARHSKPPALTMLALPSWGGEVSEVKRPRAVPPARRIVARRRRA